MKFLQAVVLAGLIPKETGGTRPNDKKLNDFILTKFALKLNFDNDALYMHPDNNKKSNPNHFRLMLHANRYLYFCLSSGIDTLQKAEMIERVNPSWDKTIIDLDDEFYNDMANIMIQLHHKEKLDIKELIYYMKIAICGREEKNYSLQANIYLAHWVSNSTNKAKKEGKKWWYQKSIKELRLYLVSRDFSPLHLSIPSCPDGMEETIKKYLVSLCMKPYAPLFSQYCRVKGLSTPTWNDRKVKVIDCRIGKLYIYIYIY